LPHHEDGTDTGTPAGRNESHARKNGCQSKGNEAEIRANNEKFEVLPVILVSQMDIHQARMESIQKMKAKMDIHHKKMDAW
jgi:hypothetical protein